jgi:hypothetical protein
LDGVLVAAGGVGSGEYSVGLGGWVAVIWSNVVGVGVELKVGSAVGEGASETAVGA